MVPSVRMLYPDGIIHLQQDHSSIHDSHVVQERLSRQADVELVDWTLRAPDMNPIENMWSEVKRAMTESMTRRMKSVVEAEWFWTSYYRGQFLKTALLRAKVFSFYMRRCNTSPVPVAGQTTAPRLLRLWVRVLPEAWTSVFCEFCVLSRLHKEICR